MLLIKDELLYTIHQFMLSLLCLFFIYYMWRDIASRSLVRFKKIPVSYITSMIIGLFIGLFITFLNEWGTNGVILSLTFAVMIALSVFDSKYAVAFFVFILISRPWEFINNDLMATMPRDISILAFSSLIGHKVVRKEIYFKWNVAHACVFFYAIWTYISIIPSDQSSRAMVIYGDVFIKLIMVYFLIVNVVKTKSQVMPIQAALTLGLLEKSLMCFHNTQFFGATAVGERLTAIGIIGNSNDLAAIMILAIPFMVAFFDTIKNFVIKYFLTSIVVLFQVILIWKTKSRGAVLGMGTLFISWYWIKAQNKKLATVVVLAGFLLVGGAMSAIKRNADDTEGSTSNRIIFWKAGLNMAVRNPLFGVGYEGYNSHLAEYAQGVVGMEGANRTAHSNWILVLAETGFVGFALYIGIWIYALRTAFIMKGYHPEYFIAIISYGTVITFLSHSYMLYPYILLALTITMGQFYNNKKVAI